MHDTWLFHDTSQGLHSEADSHDRGQPITINLGLERSGCDD